MDVRLVRNISHSWCEADLTLHPYIKSVADVCHVNDSAKYSGTDGFAGFQHDGRNVPSNALKPAGTCSFQLKPLKLFV